MYGNVARLFEDDKNQLMFISIWENNFLNHEWNFSTPEEEAFIKWFEVSMRRDVKNIEESRKAAEVERKRWEAQYPVNPPPSLNQPCC